jgi:hypothetical protein
MFGRSWTPTRPLGLLSIGVFVLIVAVCLIAYGARYITRVDEIFSLTIALYGVWVMILAGIKTPDQEGYERGTFSTFAWGALLTAIGGAWFLNIQTAQWVYSLALVLFVLGILVVAAALRSWRW